MLAGKKGSLQHILSACIPANQLLQKKYMWRHNNVPRVITEAVEQQVDHINKAESPPNSRQRIALVKEGAQPRSYRATSRPNILSSATDWHATTDLVGKGGFPIWDSDDYPPSRYCGIVRSSKGGHYWWTDWWEGNIDEAHEKEAGKVRVPSISRKQKSLIFPWWSLKMPW